MDNEFELIFVVAYQKILQLAYVDKFLSDIHLEFRDKYKNDLVSRANRSFHKYDFLSEFNFVLEEAEKWGNEFFNFCQNNFGLVKVRKIYVNECDFRSNASKTTQTNAFIQ